MAQKNSYLRDTIMNKFISVALATLFAASLSFSVLATENPFGMSDLDHGTQLSMSSKPEGKCGDGKKKEAKCGEGKCGGDKKKDGKCGEGKCGGN